MVFVSLLLSSKMVSGGMREVDPERAKKESPNYLFKVTFIGDSKVGKSSVIQKFTQATFNPAYISTIGVDFAVKTVELGSDIIKLQIWDTAGQERFRTITNSYYRGSHGIVVFFDLADRDSFENVRHWIGEIETYAHEDVTVIIAGAKADLEEERAVSAEDFEELAVGLNVDYVEISAKEGKNIDKLFELMVERMISSKKNTANKKAQKSRLGGTLARSYTSLASIPSLPKKTKSKMCSIL